MNNIVPVVALTLGDVGGIGSELIAKLLAKDGISKAVKIVLVADLWQWNQGQKIAGTAVKTVKIDDFSQARDFDNQEKPMLLEVDTIQASDANLSTAEAAGGRSVLAVLDRCMQACLDKHIDAICFAPLNKEAMKMSGMKHEDELHYFANFLGTKNYFCEFNTLGNLWTSRISSHVPLKDLIQFLDKDRIKDASKLIYHSLQANGIENPRIAVAALNPHGGDGGTCGMEEIDIIRPAVEELNQEGLPIVGPYPADTIFLKARDGELDAIVTMYHDQGQIAIKLLGFERGVTVQGGLSIPITTPAHGTAYDIAGKNKANVEATYQAFKIACRMGASLQKNRC